MGYQSRKPDAARVHFVLVMAVVAQQFARHLAHTVDGDRPLDGVLRCPHPRGPRPERTDGTWDETLALQFPRNLQDIHESAHVQIPGEHRVGLGRRGQQGRQVNDRLGAMVAHHPEQALRTTPLLNLISRECDLILKKAIESYEPVQLTDDQAKLLHVNPGELAILDQAITYDVSNIPIFLSRALIRRDRARIMTEVTFRI